ncbi:nucleolar protein 11 [Pyxicephalus adspersus]|uniref:Nucleolar protein 11 n=1 Tax=Pyxicephalus adspersus TaxID=30357 RepID=A0AAV3A5I0_PYXAD|nr:TPA: hypothetical protein GDO54_012985 [Pyxicephalus adspersus]
MAALCEELTLCGVQGADGVGPQGLEAAGDGDRVLVTEAQRTVTLYKVSDQRPLGSWTVKQGQRVTCPAVYNAGTGEIVVIHDDKVLRVWKEEDVSLEKVFKTTLSAAVCRIHSLPDSETLVLFHHGAVRYLDSLLTDPRQEIENVITTEETIKWSMMFVENGQPIIMFISIKASDLYINIWRPSPGISLRYKLQPFTKNSQTLNFTASLKKNAVSLLILYSTGHVCQCLVPLVQSSDGAESLLSVSSLLQLPTPVDSGALILLDDTHLATLTPSTEKQKDILCIWNTSFQTIQDRKTFSQKTSRQLWNYDRMLFVQSRKKLHVLRYVCEPSSLASALGKASNTNADQENVPVVSWEALTGSKTKQSKFSKKASRVKQDGGDGGCQLKVSLSGIQSSSEGQISSLVRKALFSQNLPDFQITAGKLMEGLVERCNKDPAFYPQNALIDLLNTNKLSYSLCPGVMALGLEKSDVQLLQLCLRQFIDIPEMVLCSCLKMFLSISEDVLSGAELNTTSVESYIKEKEAPNLKDKPKEPAGRPMQNGFSPDSIEEGSCDVQVLKKVPHNPEACPVSRKRAVLLNTVLTAAFSENYLLPHLKDLTTDQVILFLTYLQFLYRTCCQQLTMHLPGQKKLSITEVVDWMNLLLDANFTILVLLPKARPLIRSLQKCVNQQMQLFLELNQVEGSLSELQKLQRPCESHEKYSIEVLELY